MAMLEVKDLKVYYGMIQAIKHISNCYASIDHVLEMLKVKGGD